MKNVFRFLGLALVAGTMLISCGKEYTLTAESANENMGTVTGSGTYASGELVTLTATPKDGYLFYKWNDGNCENPREITTGKEDATYTASFVAEGTSVATQVTFGERNWASVSTTGYAYTKYGELEIYNYAEAESYPFTYLSATSAKGLHTAAIDTKELTYGDDIYACYYYTSASEIIVTVDSTNDTTYSGDYWAKSLSYNVNAFDATTGKITYTITAEMFPYWKYYENNYSMTNVSTTNMTVRAFSQALEVDDNDYGKAVRLGMRPANIKYSRIVRR